MTAVGGVVTVIALRGYSNQKLLPLKRLPKDIKEVIDEVEAIVKENRKPFGKDTGSIIDLYA